MQNPTTVFLKVEFCVALSPSKWNENINVDLKATEMSYAEILIFWVEESDELFAL